MPKGYTRILFGCGLEISTMSIQALSRQNPKTPERQATIAPGLLPVFRLAAGIRLGFMLLVVALALTLPISGQALALAVLVESVLLLAALSWPRLQRLLGRGFLPAMLAWALLSPLLVRGLLLGDLAQTGLPGAELPGGLTDYDLFVDASFNLAWLAVPVVLATWQYGRRGLVITMTVVVAGNLLGALLPENSAAARAALVVDTGRPAGDHRAGGNRRGAAGRGAAT
ncbi:MAG: hypothetical protein V9G19_11055 [Tetrasphaera sp.]